MDSVDEKNAWCIKSITNKHKFMHLLLEVMPNNAVWSIEGIDDNRLYTDLQRFSPADEISVRRGTIWPKQKMLKVLINELSRGELLLLINGIDLGHEFVHQHMYSSGSFYFSAFDNLETVYISRELDNFFVDTLRSSGLADVSIP